MYRKIGVLLLVLTMLFAGVMTVSAAPAAQEDAELLGPGEIAQGVIVGNEGGAFDYYTIRYPGGDVRPDIQVRFFPGNPATESGVGFNVWGPDGFKIGEGVVGATPGLFSLALTGEEAGEWLIQIYNYLPGVRVSYKIVVEGLPAPEAGSAPEAGPAMVPGEPLEVGLGPNEDITSMLRGSTGGSYDSFLLPYEADGSEVTVTMAFTPAHAGMDSAIGFTVWGPQGRVARSQLTAEPFRRAATFSAEEAGEYTVQVYNYLSGTTIVYRLER